VGYLAANALGRDASTTVTDPRRIDHINKMISANRRANGERGMQRIKDLQSQRRGITGDAWGKLRDMSSDMSNGKDLIRASQLAEQVAAQNEGLSVQDVMDMKTYVSGNIDTGEAVTLAGSKFYTGAEGKAGLQELLGENTFSWNDRVSGVNIAGSSGQMKAYIDSVLKNGQASDLETGALRSALGSNETFDKFRRNVGRMAANNRQQLGAAAEGLGTTRLTIEREMLTASEETSKNFLLGKLESAAGVQSADRKAAIDALNNVKGGDLNRVLESDQLKGLVSRGALGDIAKEVIGVGSNAELLKMTADELRGKYNINASNWEEIKKESPDQLRETVQGAMWDTAKAKQEQAAETTEAALLHKTAGILYKIEAHMNGSAAENKAGPKK
jgi:hypothetical protein